jgi:hypothetical protein
MPGDAVFLVSIVVVLRALAIALRLASTVDPLRQLAHGFRGSASLPMLPDTGGMRGDLSSIIQSEIDYLDATDRQARSSEGREPHVCNVGVPWT